MSNQTFRQYLAEHWQHIKPKSREEWLNFPLLAWPYILCFRFWRSLKEQP